MDGLGELRVLPGFRPRPSLSGAPVEQVVVLDDVLPGFRLRPSLSTSVSPDAVTLGSLVSFSISIVGNLRLKDTALPGLRLGPSLSAWRLEQSGVS